MEDYPREKYALLTVVAVEDAHLEVADADGVRHRVRYAPSRASSAVYPLQPGDVCIVNRVHPSDCLTVVERLSTLGRRDGACYELFDGPLAAKAQPA